MVQKRIIPIIFLSLNMFLYAEEQTIDINRYQNIIISIISNFNAILENNQASEIVYNTFVISENAVRNNQVAFEIDPRLDTVLSGMNFSIYESGEISLVFGLKYLDTYNPNSSIHYSILIHEYRHLHDYLKNTEVYLNAKEDEKESYWYELDALRIEAEFIKYYLVGKYDLSKFEEYVLYSFENNYLNSASIIILKEGMNVFFYFDNLETKYKNNEITKEEIITQLEQNGNALIRKYNDAKDNYSIFASYVEISTFRKYLIKLLTILIDNPAMIWEEVFVQYQNIGRIYENMSGILNSNSQNEYLDSIYQYWEDDIVNGS
ncbi:MAG: hypothetical protein LBQ93_03725 [Treponema sp.]|jgi:hypothetical protein|nr:hypothetical protein [Treponema sp.]